MASEKRESRVSRRKFLAWSTAAAATAGLAPLLSACSQPAAPAPTAAPAAPAATAAPAAPAAAPTKAAAAAQPPAKAAVIELKLDHHEPAQANLGKTYQLYADTVNKASNGALHITVYPAETLSKAKDAYMNCMNGVNDIAWTAAGYTPGQFALTEAFNLPMQGIKDSMNAARAMTEWYKQSSIIQKEWEQVHVLCTYANGKGMLFTTKKPINSLEDVAGLRLRVTGPATNYIKAIKANPIPTSVPESYEALSKGILDAGIYDWQAVNSQHLYEHLKWNCSLPLTYSGQVMAFNKKKWDSIPKELQDILTSPPGLMWQDWDEDPTHKGPVPSIGEFLANGFQIADIPGLRQFKEEGGQVTDLSEAEAAKFAEEAKPVWEAWAETVKDRFDGMAELAKFHEIVKQTA